MSACCLAVGLGLSGHVGKSLAIPAAQGELVDAAQPLPDFSAVVADTRSAPAPARPDPQPAAKPDSEDQSAGAAIPCMVSFDDERDPAAGESCDDGAAARQLSVAFGERMADDTSRILGDFDGVRVDYRLAGGLRLNGVAGYPVLSDNDKFNASRQVYGVSANTALFVPNWDLSSYLLEQQDTAGAQRNAGGALRYLRPKRSLLLLFDYDLAGRSLEAFTAAGAVKLPRNTTLSATVDVRSRPLGKRQRKYVQQTMATTGGWSWNLPLDRISHYTREQAGEVTTYAVGLSHRFSRHLQLTGSAAVLDVAGAEDAGEPAPSEYFYHLRLSGSDLMFTGNNNVLDLSHRVTETTRTSTATLDTRYTINRRWKVSPSLRTDYRDNLIDRSVQWSAAPSVKMEYRWRDRYGLRIEAGGEWVNRELYDEASSDSSYFVKLGYKANF